MSEAVVMNGKKELDYLSGVYTSSLYNAKSLPKTGAPQAIITYT